MDPEAQEIWTEIYADEKSALINILIQLSKHPSGLEPMLKRDPSLAHEDDGVVIAEAEAMLDTLMNENQRECLKVHVRQCRAAVRDGDETELAHVGTEFGRWVRTMLEQFADGPELKLVR